MGPQLGFHRRAGRAARAGEGRHQLDIVLVEEAIFQRDVEVGGQRVTDARNRLPGEAGVAVIDQIGRDLGARYADTAADEALQAVIGTEVEQAVQHERQSRGSPAEAAPVEIDLGALVGRFGLQTEAAEIITDIGVEIITLMIIDVGKITDRTRTREIKVLIFDQQYAGISADVPAIVTRQGRTGQGTRRKRSREGKLPHLDSPFIPHLDSPFKSVTKDC